MIVQWTKAAGATSIHRQALIRSNEIETAVSEGVREMFGGRLSARREEEEEEEEIHLSGPSLVLLQQSRAAHRGGQVMLLSGRQLQLRRTDHDEDDGDDVIGALVAAGLW